MPVGGIGDVYASRRLLVLLVGMVVVPAVVLTLFGFMAIRFQTTALEAEVARQQDEYLQEVASRLYERVLRLDEQVRAEAENCVTNGQAPCEIKIEGVSAVWVWGLEIAPPLGLEIVGSPAESGETVWTTPVDRDDNVGVMRITDMFVAWQPDIQGLVEWLQTAPIDVPPFDAELRMERSESGGTPLDRFMRPWGLQGERRLDGPLAHWQLGLSQRT